MVHPIYPCLWFDNHAQEAAEFYTSLFTNSKITSSSPMTSFFELDGVKMMGLNGGNQFRLNPSISMFVTCETNEETDALWTQLSRSGRVLMELGQYPWCEYYGWCTDKYDLTWQLRKGNMGEINQKVIPFFTFVNAQYGRAEEALKFYISIFENSEIQHVKLYEQDNAQQGGKVMHSQFLLNGEVFMAIDAPGNHNFNFNEGVSLVIECDTQQEIDRLWNTFTKNGQESMCGWCKDQFGVAWQIIPSKLKTWMSDPTKGQKVVEAFLQMKKFDIATLESV